MIIQLLILLFTICASVHDGQTHAGNRLLSKGKRKAWHFTGSTAFTALLAVVYLSYGWKITVAGVLIRIAVHDIGYNYGAGIPLSYSGDGVEPLEKLVIKIFGNYGAVKKLLLFTAIIIALNIIYG